MNDRCKTKKMFHFIVLVCIFQIVYGFTITTRCVEPGTCQTFNDVGCITGNEPNCGCMPSQRGTLCIECSSLGYLSTTGGICTCYDSTMDPNNAIAPCMPLVPVTTNEVVQLQHSHVSCTCHTSKQLGFFKLSTPQSSYTFGDPNPPTCDECISEIFGPKPGTITETLLIPLQTCNSYGGPDPEKGPNGWFSCSGHGRWDATSYRCVCDAKWRLNDLGPSLTGAFGEPGVSCNVCEPFRGPSPEAGCGKIWTVDPRIGREAECSGHGVQYSSSSGDVGCTCFSNGTHGYWELAPITAKFTTLQYSGLSGTAYTLMDTTASQQTCIKCMNGHSKPNCL
jgi:hypothetical protein